jgi:hypothetical protein
MLYQDSSVTHPNVQEVIGAAVLDAEFRQHLLKDATSVIGEFGLTPDEITAVLAVKAETFPGFASQIHSWLAGTGRMPVVRC